MVTADIMTSVFETYIASEYDLGLIEEAIKIVKNPKLEFIFNDIAKIKKTHTISYDGQFIYIWSMESEKLVYKIKHDIKLKEEWQMIWCAGLVFQEIRKFLPIKISRETNFDLPLISGGLYLPFTKLQREKNFQDNPYTTKESYLATIIHEFAHVYWNQHKLWWFSDKKENLNLITTAKRLYESDQKSLEQNLSVPTPFWISEVFAFCSEYTASDIFFPNHKKNLDQFLKKELNRVKSKEGHRNLTLEDSLLEPNRNPHNTAFVYGKIILTKYQKTWPRLLTNRFNLEAALAVV